MKMRIVSTTVTLCVCVETDNDCEALRKANNIISSTLRDIDYTDYNKIDLEIIDTIECSQKNKTLKEKRERLHK